MKKLKQHVAVKSISGIVLLLVVFSVIVSAIGFNGFTDALLSQYADGAFLTANAAANVIDTDRIEDYVKSGGTTEEYKSVWSRLDQLCNSSGSTFIYVIRPDLTDYAHITFLFSTINHSSPYSVYEFGYVRETTNEEYRSKYQALYAHKAETELVIRDKGYIETDPHITAMLALHDSKGKVQAILCVQRQMDVLYTARHAYIQKVSVALVILALLVIAGQSAYLHKVLLRPLQLITNEATRFARQNITPEKKLLEQISNEDEIGQLAGSIDLMEEQIQSYVENLTRITAEKERIVTELSLAKRIQADMLPNVFPPFPNHEEFELYASMDPAKEVGGDFYDFFLIDEDHLGLVIADVSGKGVPAALFMMASKIILANNAMAGKSPAQILADSNAAICANNREEMFVTVWLGILELSTGKLTAANGGHEYPVLKKPDGAFALLKDRHGLVIGAMDGAKYREYELQLEPGSKLFVYTDGVPEAINADNSMYGTERLIQALNRAADAGPEQILRTVRKDIDDFVDNAEQFDDLTMLCLEYRQAARPQTEGKTEGD